jgi:hypothetical protein
VFPGIIAIIWLLLKGEHRGSERIVYKLESEKSKKSLDDRGYYSREDSRKETNEVAHFMIDLTSSNDIDGITCLV